MGEPMIPLGTLMVNGLTLKPIGCISHADEDAAWVDDIRLNRSAYTDGAYHGANGNTYYIANSLAYMRRVAEDSAECELARVRAARDAALVDLVGEQGRSSTVIGEALYCIVHNRTVNADVRITYINEISDIIRKTLERMHQQIDAIAHKDLKRYE